MLSCAALQGRTAAVHAASEQHGQPQQGQQPRLAQGAQPLSHAAGHRHRVCWRLITHTRLTHRLPSSQGHSCQAGLGLRKAATRTGQALTCSLRRPAFETVHWQVHAHCEDQPARRSKPSAMGTVAHWLMYLCDTSDWCKIQEEGEEGLTVAGEGDKRRYEFALETNLGPSIFHRTKVWPLLACLLVPSTWSSVTEAGLACALCLGAGCCSTCV